ncbi:MAG TPA: hypothetical protein VK360_01705 [Acidimicrobiales bacterium]|nr:hypothetical protein [Acidimicrobiales bacterium]
MSNFKIKSLRWLAPVALVGAVGLAACGDEDATVSAKPASADAAAVAVGSDRHLENLSAEIAERAAERSAGRAQAERYVDLQQDRAQANTDNPSGEFVPGSRHVPVR